MSTEGVRVDPKDLDAVLDGQETLERDNIQRDETNLREREHKQNIPLKEGKGSTKERDE